MSGCTQIFLVRVKGKEKDLLQFKEWYSKEEPILFRKYYPHGFSYNSSFAKVWVDKSEEFSFFIHRFWQTNTDSYYSVFQIAKRFKKLEFSNSFLIHHEARSTYPLSTEGFEKYTSGKRSGFMQLAVECISWDTAFTGGIPEILYDQYLKFSYISDLLNQSDRRSPILKKLDSISKEMKKGICLKPELHFHEIISEEDFFREHLKEYRSMIINLIGTNKYTSSNGIEYIDNVADPCLLNLALKPFMMVEIPELKKPYMKIIKDLDTIADRILSGKMPNSVLRKYNNDSYEIFEQFEILKSHNIKLYNEIYSIMDEVNAVDETNNTDLPF